MHLTEVITPQLARQFIRANVELNKKDPSYIQPLDKDINDVFNPKKNKAFRFGEAIRWILKDKDGKLIGRIAAFTNKKYKNKGDDGPVGGIGFLIASTIRQLPICFLMWLNTGCYKEGWKQWTAP